MYNYSKKDLERMTTETGFIRDNLEKVLRLCDVLQYFNENPLFTERLALKGGTAVNLTVFNFPIYAYQKIYAQSPHEKSSFS
jgi:hypothetical protein